jgi:hypothetical protein
MARDRKARWLSCTPIPGAGSGLVAVDRSGSTAAVAAAGPTLFVAGHDRGRRVAG